VVVVLLVVIDELVEVGGAELHLPLSARPKPQEGTAVVVLVLVPLEVVLLAVVLDPLEVVLLAVVLDPLEVVLLAVVLVTLEVVLVLVMVLAELVVVDPELQDPLLARP